jgi:hypothetical protein
VNFGLCPAPVVHSATTRGQAAAEAERMMAHACGLSA